MTCTSASSLARSTARRISPGIAPSMALSRSGRSSVMYAFRSRVSYRRAVKSSSLIASSWSTFLEDAERGRGGDLLLLAPRRAEHLPDRLDPGSDVEVRRHGDADRQAIAGGDERLARHLPFGG